MALIRYPTPFGMIVLELKIKEDSRRAPQHGRYSIHVEAVSDEFVTGMQAAIEGHGFTHESEMRAAGWTLAHNILTAVEPVPEQAPAPAETLPVVVVADQTVEAEADPLAPIAPPAPVVETPELAAVVSPAPDVDPTTGEAVSDFAPSNVPDIVAPAPEVPAPAHDVSDL